MVEKNRKERILLDNQKLLMLQNLIIDDPLVGGMGHNQNVVLGFAVCMSK